MKNAALKGLQRLLVLMLVVSFVYGKYTTVS